MEVYEITWHRTDLMKHAQLNEKYCCLWCNTMYSCTQHPT